MKKQLIITVIFISLFSSLSAQNSLKQKFIKGNISDKTSAVREASGEDGLWLSRTAIEFVLDNKEILGNDRELDGLAVAAIYSYPQDYLKRSDAETQQEFVSQCITLFNSFNSSSTVQIAVLSKILSLKDYISTAKFTDLLNQFLSSDNLKASDSSIVKSCFSSLETIGNNESFVILYNLWNNPSYSAYYDDIENTLITLIPVSMSEVIQIINLENFDQLSRIYYLINKNNKISTNLSCEIAENILNESILLTGSSSINPKELTAIQSGSLQKLNENKWTRASSTVLSYFETAKKEYAAKQLDDEQFNSVIRSVQNIAALTAVVPLTNYLEELNKQKENSGSVSAVVITSVIESLGAIGDKSAFDSLLAVTYLNYPESVLTAARDALAGLRW